MYGAGEATGAEGDEEADNKEAPGDVRWRMRQKFCIFSLCLWLYNGIHSSELVKLYTKKVNVTVHKL